MLIELYLLGETFELDFLKRICLEKIRSSLTLKNVREMAPLASRFESKKIHEVLERFLIEKLPTMTPEEKSGFLQVAKDFEYVFFLFELWKSSKQQRMRDLCVDICRHSFIEIMLLPFSNLHLQILFLN